MTPQPSQGVTNRYGRGHVRRDADDASRDDELRDQRPGIHYRCFLSYSVSRKIRLVS